MNPNIIAMGFTRGKDALLICNQSGLDQLPEPIRIEKGEGWHEPDGSTSKSFYVWIAATVPNITGLIMLGLITRGDAKKILEGVVKQAYIPEELKCPGHIGERDDRRS